MEPRGRDSVPQSGPHLNWIGPPAPDSNLGDPSGGQPTLVTREEVQGQEEFVFGVGAKVGAGKQVFGQEGAETRGRLVSQKGGLKSGEGEAVYRQRGVKKSGGR